MRIVRRAGEIRGGLAGCWIALLLAAATAAAADAPLPGDDWTFRPTVLIRKGRAQGSGTVIASARGETLVLTAAHVVEGPGPLRVELHRYNLGAERIGAGEGWPLSVAAKVVAADVAADVAVLRVAGLAPLPFVARLAAGAREPAPGTVVTSIGIDLGTRLSAWNSRIAKIDQFAMNGSGHERLFLITARPPEHGRSGGGLFLDGGELVGVCVGRAEFVKGRRSGVFASSSSVRRLLRRHDLDALVDRSAAPRGRAPVTPTRARTAR